ncbi:thermonuclease family protein [Paludifilum halophilum]|uniref:TNase-like domain-containing protein n=1 Tax=Paludifilum halophilum TaxID=1642702 RepID=A0A235BCI3_9BACL|nr:thermonuclease family protein [Paludifilum halophilum]OYD09657.1 hypothetical protein CHM34_01220 [Paludifilum halophilum]
MRKVALILFLALVLLTGCQSDSGENPDSSRRIPVELVRVVDGDTVTVNIEGKKESVRFLLVDTPETNHPRLGEQPYGAQAKSFTKKMLNQAETVELEKDVSERDKYGRLLAYLYADGVSVQEELLKKGLARVAYIYPPNVKYVDRYRSMQEEARHKQRGIWEVENYVQEDGFKKEVIENHEKGRQQEQKGEYIASKNSEVYHKVSCPDADTIKRKNRIYFETEQEAKASGRRRSRSPDCW